MLKTILVVEDNKDAMLIISTILERRGFYVLRASDVRSAIVAGNTTDFDLLLCDIGLPDGTGNDVLHHLRVHERHFPAIALTAHSSSPEIEEQIAAGFDLHVSKPFTLEHLRDAVDKLLSMPREEFG